MPPIAPPAAAPPRNDTSLIGQIAASADAFQLPRELVLAICQVESNLNGWACRHEPAYRYLWDISVNRALTLRPDQAAARQPPAGFKGAAGISSLTEWIAQQTSWGLMQVMGATAREYGFRGHLPQLCFPTDGLAYGCRHLVQLKGRFYATHGWAGVVSAYNSGQPTGDDEYVGRVAGVSPGVAALIRSKP